MLIGCLLYSPYWGLTKPATRHVHGMTPNQWSHTGQGKQNLFFKQTFQLKRKATEIVESFS